MRNQLFIVLITMALIMSLSAGEKVNFAGDWSFSEEKSTLDEMGRAFIQTKMSVIQSENDMTIAKTFETPDQGEVVGEEKLTLDGKECKSEIWGGTPRVSTANWNEAGDVLKIASKITFERDGQPSTMDLDEEWSLSEDGKLLTIKHSSTSDWGERNITMVFGKVEKEK
ncbi:hypothetical protein EH223_04445 [candidate division KSB1 bacterium]|nr:hypothetical protein [candidate division KSB1 bacterium]RQW05532.1 MAG: hypothetical protein EH223_04445 [candidate division KSB1 bacterium]